MIPTRPLVVIACLFLCACEAPDPTADLTAMTCKDVADQTIDAAKGRIVKIYHQTVRSRDAAHLICDGTGFLKSGHEIPLRYQAFIDEDHDVMIKWDSDEYQAEQERFAQSQADREADQDAAEAQREMHAALNN